MIDLVKYAKLKPNEKVKIVINVFDLLVVSNLAYFFCVFQGINFKLMFLTSISKTLQNLLTPEFFLFAVAAILISVIYFFVFDTLILGILHSIFRFVFAILMILKQILFVLPINYVLKLLNVRENKIDPYISDLDLGFVLMRFYKFKDGKYLASKNTPLFLELYKDMKDGHGKIIDFYEKITKYLFFITYIAFLYGICDFNKYLFYCLVVLSIIFYYTTYSFDGVSWRINKLERIYNELNKEDIQIKETQKE